MGSEWGGVQVTGSSTTLSGRNGEIFNVKKLPLAPQWVVRCLRKRPLNETRDKELVQRRKSPSGVSFSHLSKHRLINALAAEINETDILVKTHRRAYR